VVMDMKILVVEVVVDQIKERQYLVLVVPE
jgi:hypothetical protein